jgi:glycosyltransferase involved in cell wall biosynthesis
MHFLNGSGSTFRLLIAGEGKLLGHLQRKARKLRIHKQVEFLGFVDDMPSFFNSIDIFLLTSRYEGFSNVIPEAMASGKPVISFDIRSSSEIIQEGYNGYIVPQEDIPGMGARILELVRNPDQLEAMGKQARQVVEERFSFEKVQVEIKELIQRSLRS